MGILKGKPSMEKLLKDLDEANRAASGAFDSWLNDACARGLETYEGHTQRAGLLKHFEALSGIYSDFIEIHYDSTESKDVTLALRIPLEIARSAADAANRQAEITKAIFGTQAGAAVTDNQLLHANITASVAARHATHAAAATASARDAAQAARDATRDAAHVTSPSSDRNGPRWQCFSMAMAETIDCAGHALTHCRHVLYRIDP